MYHIEHEFERQSILRVISIYIHVQTFVRLTSSSEMPCMYICACTPYNVVALSRLVRKKDTACPGSMNLWKYRAENWMPIIAY